MAASKGERPSSFQLLMAFTLLPLRQYHYLVQGPPLVGQTCCYGRFLRLIGRYKLD